jgi:SAM-dependent methyltransferase
MTGSGYERDAEGFIAWFRTPGHDSYWWYSPAFFEEIVPPPGDATLEIGCGEGRACRDLAARGHSVTGVDLAPTLVAAAREAHPDGTYLVADAAALPFRDGAFDLVLSYNSLMDVADMPGAVREAARVLAPGGRLCVSVTHPLIDAGAFESREPDAVFRIEGSYLAAGRRRRMTLERDGLSITFEDNLYSLEAYARALEDAGLLVERIREPAYTGDDERKRRVPQFLWLRALKVTTAASDTLS